MCARVWRRRSERLYAANIAEHDRYAGRSVLVCGGTSLNGRTDLVVLNRGTLTGQQYIDDTLDNQVRLYAGADGGQFILMDNNSGPHRTRVVQDYLEMGFIERIDWPACSLDLNPKEHMWNVE
jgi:hypothetical protein